MNNRIRIPLAVDSQLRIPLGPVQLPIRTCVALAVAIVPMCVAFEIPVGLGLRFALAACLLAAAVASASPLREGIWLGTFLALRVVSRWAPDHVVDGRVQEVQAQERSGLRKYLPQPRLRHRVGMLLKPVERDELADSMFKLKPGGWRGVLAIDGPPCALDSKTYARWSDSILAWIRGLEVPAQLVTVVGHVNAEQAETAFDDSCEFEPRNGPLVQMERVFAGDLATKSLAFRHYLVLSPGVGDGETFLRWSPRREARAQEVSHLIAKALSSAKAAAISARSITEGEMAELLATSQLGDGETHPSDGAVRIRDLACTTLVVNTLGTDAQFGMLVEAVQRSGMHGSVSMHLIPVPRETVRQQLNKRRLWLRYALREGRPDIDLEVSLQDTEKLQADLAAGSVEGLRVGLSLRVTGADRSEVAENTERLRSVLAGHGWQAEQVTMPPLAPATVGAPGTAPLRRSVLLTTDAVAARLLPALGTPFASVGDPIVGVNLRTGSSAYLSVFTRPNYNAVIVGSSGSGKSVTAKTFLARHVMRGAGACILDPDSEYGDLVRLLGGNYFELPQASLNPLGLGREDSPDLAASRIVPVLSVMAGDENEYVGGRPIRRLPNEDKAWLHLALRSFLFEWRKTNQGEPLLREFVDFIADDQSDGAAAERIRRIVLRLRGFTQGELGQIFDRPSSFEIVPGQVTGIGFRSLSLSYAADLTPALCVVLSHILDAIVGARQPMIVLVDEAHVLTSDPDAGQVLEQLVRRARKCRAGVWMASQRIEEFTSTELGRTLASTAATKFVLGHEDTVAEKVRSLFDLADDESAALTPPVPGRAVLIAGSERTVVQVTPSQVLWPFISTSGEADAA